MGIDIFGQIDPNNLEKYYEGTVVINGVEVEVDLNLESDELEKGDFEVISTFVDSLESYANRAFSAISNDFDQGEESEAARFYLQHHLDAFSEEETKAVFGNTPINKESFMKALSLHRIGLYPEDEESFAVFDIQFSADITHYLLAVVFNLAGQVTYISVES
ncbi:DUF2004 domain-containing protein [Hahella sp. HN01]|uniref:DUF2004 domain-containing protein n=1 Tax=Hahella sp. HN01 TaxID=2847262 RepID=UPI001C1E99AA|nr:DUF2004 domain-containing protein [Hahella sp. HN01]MBU6955376.1 DUF2004 domain-containing protein [Hahella sp. HN01]